MNLSLPGVITRGAGALTCLLALLVLIGWATETTFLVQVSADWAPTQPNTAVGLGLCGLTLLGFALGWRRVPLACAALVVLVSGLSLLQYWTGSDLGIDRLLINPFTQSQTAYAGRMSVETALMFLLVGTATLALQFQGWQRQHDLISAGGGVFVFGFAGVSLFTYAIGATQAHLGLGGYSRMGFLTSVGFLFCGAGIFFSSWARTPVDRIIVPRWIPVALGTLAAVLAVGGWQVVKIQEIQEISYVTQRRLDSMGTAIRNHILATTYSLERMAARSSVRSSDEAHGIWRVDASSYVEHEPAYLLIQWLENGREPWEVRNEGLKVWRGSPSDMQVLDQYSDHAMNSGESQVVLTHLGANKVLVLAVPVFGPEGITGAIRAVLDAKMMLAQDVPAHDEVDFLLFVRVPGAEEVSIGGVPGRRGHQLGVSGAVSILGEQWELELRPSDEMINRVSRSGFTLFLFGVAIATILIVGVSYLARQLMLERTNLHDLRLAVDQACILAVTDEKGMIQYINEKFIEISQYSERELIGNSHRIINSGFHSKEFFAQMWATIKSGQVWRGEVQNRRKDGTIYWMDSMIVPFLNAVGKPVQYMALRFDITEKKAIEQEIKELNASLELQITEGTRELEEMNAGLQRSNKELEQFAYVASHDLQEPLRMVASYTELLSRRYRDTLDDDAKEFIDYASDGARRMQQLITDLLEFSRISTRGNQLEPVELDEVVETVLHDLQLTIQEIDAEILVAKMPRVMADRGQIASLFQNLVSNAIKYRGERKPVIEISAERTGHFWELTISDNGIGMGT